VSDNYLKSGRAVKLSLAFAGQKLSRRPQKMKSASAASRRGGTHIGSGDETKSARPINTGN
jgi:hypothetical protein